MQDIVSAVGVVGSDPTLMMVGNGLARLTFRLGSNQRRFNRDGNAWENGETNWYTVVAFRRLAENGAKSLSRGDRVVVMGRLKVNEWERDGKHGISVELLADGIGHDLMFGTTVYTKNSAVAPGTSPAPVPIAVAATQGQAPDVSAVDADGWALPGGPAGSSATAQATASVTASASAALDVMPEAVEERDAEDQDEPEARELVFSDAEPPF
ncbi:single-stranded DNA-binding protein [Humibacter soli]